MEEIARIDLVKYRCISADIRSSVVVLTDNQQQHIIQRRGTAFWEQLVIRLALTGDDPQLQNSVITAILENSKRFSQRLRNNRPLYKRE